MKLTKEVRIALVAIFGIIILFYGLKFLKGMAMFSDNNTYYIQFDDVSGLGVSRPIFADGYQVGVVTGVKYDYSHAEPTKVEVGLDKKMVIPVGTKALIESDMLGNVRVTLKITDTGNGLHKPGDTIQGAVNGGAMSQLASMIPTLELMLPKLDSIMASVNSLLADPSILRSMHNIETITADLTTSTKQFNRLLTDINRDLPGMMVKADTLLNNSQRLTGNLAQVDVDATVGKLNQTLDNMQRLSAELADNNGTLGKLVNDSKLYDNLNATMESANALLTNLKENPKRYVHFSVFGKKDKQEN